MNPFVVDRVKDAITGLPAGKATGNSGFLAEALTCVADLVAFLLTVLDKSYMSLARIHPPTF